MIRMLLACLFPLLLAAAPPVDPGSPEGRWALHAGGRTLMILELHQSSQETMAWHGGIFEPRDVTWSGGTGGYGFTHIAGPVIVRPMRVAMPGDGVRVVPVTPAPGRPDGFQFRLARDGTGRLSILDAPDMPPLILVRATAGESVAADGWDPARRYLQDQEWTSNAEVAALFTADQAARQDWGHVDHDAVARADAARRARVHVLLDAGALASGSDYYDAAFIYQHGDRPSDYLLAHAFALVAVARGRPDASWIGAATLDRYLQSIHQPQIFGTQFLLPTGAPATQEPYDRALVPDALREALGVPPLAAQEERRRRYDADRAPH